MRASDQDRDEAVLALSDHYADGRLDHDEFESRMSAASRATYLHDLDPLFADLPPRPRPRPVVGERRPLPVRRAGPRGPFAPFVALVVVTALVLTQGRAMWVLLPLWWVGLAVTRRRAWDGPPGPTSGGSPDRRPRTAWRD
jgi:hypothetical protein